MLNFNFKNTMTTNMSFFKSAKSLGVFSIADFNSWKSNKETEEKGKTQKLDSTKHTDTTSYHGNHGNSGGYHSNNHSNGGGYHSDNHSNAEAYHSDNHTNSVALHSNNHSDGTTVISHSDHSNHSNNHFDHNQDSHDDHRDVHGDRSPHTNDSTRAHADNGGHSNSIPARDSGHSNNVPHSDGGHSNNVPHSDNGGHSNYRPHSDNGGHNNNSHANSGFDHENYMPSKPHLFELDDLSDPKAIREVTKIGLYSYDKNNDGDGTQDTQSKTVKYYMRIRQVKNLDGSSNVSSWRNLITNATTDSYDLNTVDPLGTGNTDEKLTEGFYEIEAWAINDPKSILGVSKTYESEHKVVTVKIQQNNEPEIIIENGNEFINFVFGPIGATENADGNFTAYEDGLYSEAPSDKKEGIFVSVTMKDPDKTPFDQWQRAKV
ncbi:hypothetical protein, partial [Wukongibacter baidiensis]